MPCRSLYRVGTYVLLFRPWQRLATRTLSLGKATPGDAVVSHSWSDGHAVTLKAVALTRVPARSHTASRYSRVFRQTRLVECVYGSADRTRMRLDIRLPATTTASDSLRVASGKIRRSLSIGDL